MKTYFLLPLLLLALLPWKFAESFFPRAERLGRRLAAPPWRAIAMVGLVSLMLNAALSLCIRIRPPQTHDEFGYLLLGDTFAHGRLTNQPLPIWQHLETIHQIQQPTYTAKYPPAEGLFLAIGERLGNPIIGAWLATALACAALCWMLQAWVTPEWSLIGGLLAAFHPQLLAWGQNYWGGSIALAAGALLLGGARRFITRPRAAQAACMGAAMFLLANSRPFEGFVIAALTLPVTVVWCARSGRLKWDGFWRKFILPIAAAMVLLAAQMGYYNWRVTGDPLVMPYMVHIQTYGIDPVFVFSKPRPEPAFRHPDIRKLQEFYLAYYRQERSSWGALAHATWEKAAFLAQSYLWSLLLLVPLLGLPQALWRDRLLALMVGLGAVFTGIILLETWMHAHYAAPAAAIFFLAVVASMRVVHGWERQGERPGRKLMWGLALLLAISTAQVVRKMQAEDVHAWYYQRAALLRRLQAAPGKCVVIVRYRPDHNPNREWVYNEADIPGSKVIWARDMGEARNRELVDYFKDRTLYVLDADAPEPRVQPYRGGSGAGSGAESQVPPAPPPR